MAGEITSIGEIDQIPLPLEVASVTTLIEVEDASIPETPVAYHMTLAQARMDGNVIPVTHESHFGVPVAGVITLLDDMFYEVRRKDVALTSQLKGGEDSCVCGVSPRSSGLIYTGAAASMIDVTDNTMEMTDLTVSAPGKTIVSGDASGVGGGKNFIARRVLATACTRFAELDSMGCQLEACTISAETSGVRMSGSGGVFFAMDLSIIDVSGASGVCIDLGTSVFQNIIMSASNLIAQDASGTCLSGMASSGNMAAGFTSSIQSVSFFATGGGDTLSGITTADIRYAFKDTPTVGATRRIAETDLNTEETVAVAVSGTFYRVNGVNWTTSLAEHFTVSTGGEITYIGEQTRSFVVALNASVQKVGGGSDEIAQRIGVDTGSGYTTFERTTAVTKNTEFTSVHSQGVFEFSTGDKIASFVANNDGASDILVNHTSIIVAEV